MSSGPEEELNFGQDAAENGLFILRLIAILIFTVHNVSKESDGQSYAEILQRTVLLQNAFTAAFEFSGHIIKRCVQLQDAVSSFLLPAILVFIEWLACHHDIAAGSDVEEKQGVARSFFWNQCVTLMNKLISSGLFSGDGDEDQTCFFDMSRYDEGETGNRLALWEDFELRGFLPLVPAQLILDFSRKHSYGSDGSEKEKQARVQRILAAGRALMGVVRVDQNTIYFDPRLKRFVIGIEPPVMDYDMCNDLSDASNLNLTKPAGPVESTFDYGTAQPKAQVFADGEDEEEEIVFKPTVGEKHPSITASTSMSTANGTNQHEQISTKEEWAATSMSTANETIQPAQISSKGEWANYGTQLPTPLSNVQMPAGFHTSSSLDLSAVNQHEQISTKGEWAATSMSTASETIQPAQISSKGEWPNFGIQIPVSLSNFQMPTGLRTSSSQDLSGVNFFQQPLPHMNLNTSKWLTEQAALISNGLKNFNINGNGFLANQGSQEGLSSMQPTAFAFSPLVSSSSIDPISSRSSGQPKFAESFVPSTLDSVMLPPVTSDALTVKPSGPLLTALRKAPVSRPVRHLGPPPGFSNIPSKQLGDFSLELGLNEQNPQIDDYSWLDGYQSSSGKALGMESSVNHAAHMYQHPPADSTVKLNGAMSFPFPGKQVSGVQAQVINEKWQNIQPFDHHKANSEQQLQQASFQPSMMPEQHQAQSLWSGYFV
ncbi:uncharacterized protein A4U43_C05F32860 [Asparagus officinalis]|uniref:DNA/RNA-binding domain-containing protein n=2 Tax=Asparagus officinalis TaxID=4686 RepID=A0A5P1EWY2_ASPOF|nr:uncharacterized protein A4U43_C05F32860 [Asparagus officinalis]